MAKGRPNGARNVTDTQTVETSRCIRPGCESTDRAPYGKRRVQAYAGVLADGTPYTHIVRRPTKCLACGQARIDRSYENCIAGEELTSE
jgi:hypothetical protein